MDINKLLSSTALVMGVTFATPFVVQQGIEYVDGIDNYLNELKLDQFVARQPQGKQIPIKYRDKVVGVITHGGTGSGAFLNEDLILTAAHVIYKSGGFFSSGGLSDPISIVTPGEKIIQAYVVGFSNKFDIALLSTKKIPKLPDNLMDSIGKSTQGQKVRAIGYGEDSKLMMTTGSVGPTSHLVATMNSYDLTAVSGMSGGPVRDSETGQIISIVSRGYPLHLRNMGDTPILDAQESGEYVAMGDLYMGLLTKYPSLNPAYKSFERFFGELSHQYDQREAALSESTSTGYEKDKLMRVTYTPVDIDLTLNTIVESE